MKITIKSLVAFLSALVFIFLVWYFRNIVTYVLISGVLSIMGRPLVELLCKIHIKKIRFPRPLSALLTLVVIWGLVALFMWVFVPLITKQINYLATIDSSRVVLLVEEPLARLEEFFRTYGGQLSNGMTIREFLTNKVSSILDIDLIQRFLGSAFGIVGNTAIGVGSVSFITFFFLKDQHLFFDSILMWIPDKYTEGFTRALNSISRLLTRYFVGIVCQSTCVMIIIDIGMVIVGIEPQQAMVMGLIIGVLNIIPYIGPWIGFFIAMVMGIASHISMDFSTVVWPLMAYMAIVVALTQVIDNMVFTPIIYSNSVKAHPLEIFIVVLAAGSFAGIGGMIISIPAYTVIRVFAKEFFNNFKAIQKITSNLEEVEPEKHPLFKGRRKPKTPKEEPKE